jgi:HEAT repeat protein
MDDRNGAALPQRQQIKSLLVADFSGRSEADLGALLRGEDMRVRLKAQFELAKRGSAGATEFQKALAQQVSQLARVHAIWGISQMARQDEKWGELLLPLLRDNDPEIRAQAAKWLGDIRYKKAGKNLTPLLKDTFSRARFFAAEALGRIAFEPAIGPIIELLKENNDEDAYLRHAGSLALARIGKPAPVVALSNHPSRAVRIAAVVALRRMSHPGVGNFLNDTDEYVVTEAARAINDDLSIKDALPALGAVLKNTRFTNEALVRRAINANLRTGTTEGLQNLIGYASAPNSLAKMRAEAIAALSTWARPSVVDRVDGRYRGAFQRDLTQLKNNAANVLIQLLKDKDADVRTSTVKAVGKLNIREAIAPLQLVFKADPLATVRVEA